ncbi:MAG: GAF domain-containing protein [Deltaproteobacteria bacterium]|nr:GAF domain-containing protein [Deltaproteobacteria bacterium]
MTPDPQRLSVTLHGVRRMLEGVVPPTICTVCPDGMPHVAYLSIAEYVDPDHVALSWQFFNTSRQNVLATRRAALGIDDPYNGAGIALQLEYERTDTSGPIFERMRARLAGVASHAGMDGVFHLRGADIYRVLEIRRVPGRKDFPAAMPRCDVMAGARVVSERLAACEDLGELVDTAMCGLADQLRIEHAMVWMLDKARGRMTLLASHGYDRSGIGAEIPLGVGVIGTCVREAVPIRIGHMAGMTTYGRAVRERAAELGVAAVVHEEIPLPGLAAPRSQLAVPLRARGQVLGALFVESLHDQFFSYDDEDALALLCAQLAGALVTLPTAEPAADPAPAATRALGATSGRDAPPLRIRRYPQDDSVFLDDEYLIKGVAGAILWKLARDFTSTGRVDYSNRELRLAGQAIGLPDIQDNLEVRLLLLQRRLAERKSGIQIVKTGRGRFRLDVQRPLALAEA